jgi:hypothetical protein
MDRQDRVLRVTQVMQHHLAEWAEGLAQAFGNLFELADQGGVFGRGLVHARQHIQSWTGRQFSHGPSLWRFNFEHPCCLADTLKMQRTVQRMQPRAARLGARVRERLRGG